MSIWGFVASGAGTIGVIAGGALTQSLSWHWIFLINVPIGVAALALARPLLPRAAGTGLAGGVDLGGALAVVGAPVLAVYGIINAGVQGWASPTTLLCLLVALGIGIAFVVLEMRVSVPLLPLRVFRSRTVAVTNVMTGLDGAAFFGWFFFSPLYAQRVLGYDSSQTGLAFVPAMLTMGVLSMGLAAKIVSRFGARVPLVVGMLIFAAGMLLFARAPVNGSFVPDLLAPMLVLGLGSGVSFMPLLLIATAEVAPSASGLVSGLISMSQMIGGAVGLALLAGLAAARTSNLLTDG